MKKFIKIILGIVLFIIIAAVALTVFVYVRMKDDTDNTNPDIIEKNISLSEAVNKHLALALDNTKTTGKAELSLNEYDLNEISYAVSKIIPSSKSLEVISCYLELDEENYYLNVPMKVFGRQTLIKGKLTLNIDQEKFTVGLKEVNIGKISIKSFLVKGILNFFTSKLNSLGITLAMHDDAMEASITREKIGELLNKGMEKSEFGGLVNALFNIFFIENDCFIFNVNNPLDVKLTVDLTMFEGSTTSELDGIKNDVKTLLDNKKIKIEDVSTAVLYFASGYQHLSDESKNKVDEVLGSVYDPVTLQSNPGYINRTPASMKDIILAQAGTASTKGLNITDANLTTVFSNLNLLGVGAGFATYDTHLVSYVVLDSFKAKIQNDFLQLSLGININGYRIIISCSFNVPPKDDYSVEATLSDMSIGVKSIGEHKNAIFDFIANSISEEEWIRVSDKPNTLIFDFKSFFNDSTILKALLENTKAVRTSLYRSDDNSGYINIKLSLL